MASIFNGKLSKYQMKTVGTTKYIRSPLFLQANNFLHSISQGMGLPWIGFAFGCTLARLTRRPTADVIAIAIETGVQNTGMSIFILWFTLDQPLGDMTGLFHLLQYILIKKLLTKIRF